MYVRRNSKYFWGSNCRCYTTSILADEDDFINSLNNDTPLDTSRGAIKDVPESYKSWLADNADRIERAKAKGTLPYFLRDNKGYSGLEDSTKYGYKNSKLGKKSTKEAINEYHKKGNNTPIKLSPEQRANINEIAKEIGIKTKQMDFFEANEGKSNIRFKEGGLFEQNCQSTVLVHEARRRGLDITALPYVDDVNSISSKMGEDSALGWLNIKGNKPQLTKLTNDRNKTLFARINKQCKSEGRYVIGVNYKDGRGHIVTAERLKSGDFIVYDPQCGFIKSLKEEINDTEYIEILRIDNLLIDKDILKHVSVLL